MNTNTFDNILKCVFNFRGTKIVRKYTTYSRFITRRTYVVYNLLYNIECGHYI